MQLPQLALSVRQPWAWAIINAPIRGGDGKDIENCGCTEYDACPGGCGWAEPDLCTSCQDTPA